MKIPADCHRFEHPARWREWLELHHATEKEVWLVIYKKKYADQGLALDEAIEEALCYGWIDGTLNRLDEKRYRLRFSPRTPKSIWSIRNIRRAEKLIRLGKMTEAGFQKIKEAKANGEWEAAVQREQVETIPEELENALRPVKGALSAYRSLPVSRKKQYVYWLQNAKREETKQKRIRKILESLLSR